MLFSEMFKKINQIRKSHPYDTKEADRQYTLLPTTIEGSTRSSVTYRSSSLILWQRGIFALTAIFLVVSFWSVVIQYTEECQPAWSSIAALECHHNIGKQKLEKLLNSQSKSPAQAIERYRQKYHREPPEGFEHWVTFALENQSPIIDDYDQLEADLKPLRNIPSEILKARVQAVSKIKTGRFGIVEIKDGVVRVGDDKPQHLSKKHRATKAVIQPIAQYLPDMQWIGNWADLHVVRGQTEMEKTNRNVTVHTFSGEEAEDVLQAQCPSNNLAKTEISNDRPSLDLCQSSHGEHGTFHSPGVAFNSSLPVISVGKFSTFEDILAPWCYADYGYTMHKDDQIPSFAEKKPVLYWRGGTNGLQDATVDNWHYNHRARSILRLSQMKEHLSNVHILPSDSMQAQLGKIDYRLPDLSQQQISALSRLSHHNFDVGRARGEIFSGEEKELNPNKTAFIENLVGRVAERERENAFRYRFLLDMDGVAVSCRFYRLMGGGGVVFKQTKWAEWHDDRLVPYVHYIPVDMDINQIPLFMDMMINTQAGERLASTIGDEAKRWSSSSLRKIDITILYYRLLLELAQIYRS